MIHRLAILSFVSFVAALACAGCAGEDNGAGVTETAPADPIPAPPEPEGDTYDPATATARISGTVAFEGTPPEMPMLQMGADFYCNRNFLGTRDNEVLVTEDGRLQNVIVYVRSGHDDALYYAPPPGPVILDQQGCVYRPRALTIMTGQELRVRNSDDAFRR